MKAVSPYLNFAGKTEEAFRFYESVFGGELQIVRFRDFPANPMGIPQEEMDKVANAALPLVGENMLMGSDSVEAMGQELTPGNDFSIALEAESAEEAERLFGALSEGGEVAMPLAKTEWAEQYGLCQDKYGIRWMVNYTGDVRFEERQ